jgi:hypothetical protein
MVLRQEMTIVGIGLATGLILGIGISKAISRLLYGVGTGDLRAAMTRVRIDSDDSVRRDVASSWSGTAGTSIWMSMRSINGPEIFAMYRWMSPMSYSMAGSCSGKLRVLIR